MPRRGRDAGRRRHRGQRDRGRGGARGDPCGPARRQARGARQQRSARDGGRARDPGGARGGRGDRAGGLGAQRRAPVHHGAPPHRARAAHPHGVGRPVPHLDAGAGRGGHGGGGAAPSHVAHGKEDHGRLRHPRQQGARGDRGALPVRVAVPRGRGRGAPAPAGRCGVARGGAGDGRRGAPAGAGGRVLLTLVALAVVLGPLIFVHEMGHFVAAKAVGIQVLRFSLGFGRPIFAWRRGETEYWISWIPLGGYVKMAGLEDEGVAGSLEGGKASVPIDPARAFDRQPVWKRTIVILAGVTMNIVFAYCVFAGIAATVGAPELASTQIESVTTRTLPPGTETLGTLKFGDRIVRVNGDTVRSWNAIIDHVLASSTTLRLDLAGRAEPIVVRLPDVATRQAVASALVRLDPPRLGLLGPGQPALRAGLKPGDLLLRVNGDTLRSWSDVLHAVWNSPGK